MSEITSDEWYTPIHLLTLVFNFYGGNFLDPASCAEAQKYVKASKFYSKYDDGLSLQWSDRIWLNPPYSQPLIKQFTGRLIFEYKTGTVKEALCLVNASTETEWFQDIAQYSDRRLDFRKRLKFWHPNKTGDSPRYGQTLFYIGKNCDLFEHTFGELGLVYSKPKVVSKQLSLF